MSIGCVSYWPIGLATATTRHGGLLGVNLPAAGPFVNPNSAHHGLRRQPLDAGDVSRPSTCRRCARNDASGAIGREALDSGTMASRASIRADGVPRPSTCRAAAPGAMPVARSAASGASVKLGEPGEALRRGCRRRAAPLDVPCRCARPMLAARSAEAVDAGMVASGAGSSRASPAMPARGRRQHHARRAWRGAPPRAAQCRRPRRVLSWRARTDGVFWDRE